MLDKRHRAISVYILVRVSIVMIFCTAVTVITYKTNYLLEKPKFSTKLLSRLQGPLSTDNSQLIEILKYNYLVPPTTMPYNLTVENESDEINSNYFELHNRYNSKMIHHYIRHLFGNQHSGFFIEAGALDGQFISNTLWLEKDMGWNGLLVEADPFNYKLLHNKRRHAWISNTCISSKNYPHQVLIESMQQLAEMWGHPWTYRARSKIYDPATGDLEIVEEISVKSYSNVQCFPLWSYLLALNVTTVDFLSLDIQGHEWEVLRKLPLKELNIRVIVAEHFLTDKINDKNIINRNSIDHSFIKYMENNGYKLIDIDNDPNFFFILDTEKVLIDIATNNRSSDGRTDIS